MNPFSSKPVIRMTNRSDHRWAHHVAVLTLGGAIVAVGYNKGSMHAEEMALRKLQMASGRASRLYSIRLRRDGRLGASRPCEACLKLIRTSGVKHVYFSDYDGSEQRMVVA